MLLFYIILNVQIFRLVQLFEQQSPLPHCFLQPRLEAVLKLEQLEDRSQRSHHSNQEGLQALLQQQGNPCLV